MASISTPYAGSGTWLRGNVHAHTTLTDGHYVPNDLIAEYERRGYDFLAVSEHDRLVDPEEHRADTPLVFLPAVEVTANGPHLLHLDATTAVEPRPDRGAVLDEIGELGGMAVLAHPNWEADFEHWPQAALDRLDYGGIEIYNGNIDRCAGAASATDRWDRLLSAGRVVWGFGTDDTHLPTDVGNAWTTVRVEDRTPGAILEALRAGRSYVSTGVTIEEVTVVDERVSVTTADADRIRLVSDGGAIQRTVEGAEATFAVPDDLGYEPPHTYVRIECLGRGGETAWTQPLFLDGRL